MALHDEIEDKEIKEFRESLSKTVDTSVKSFEQNYHEAAKNNQLIEIAKKSYEKWKSDGIDDAIEILFDAYEDYLFQNSDDSEDDEDDEDCETEPVKDNVVDAEKTALIVMFANLIQGRKV